MQLNSKEQTQKFTDCFAQRNIKQLTGILQQKLTIPHYCRLTLFIISGACHFRQKQQKDYMLPPNNIHLDQQNKHDNHPKKLFEVLWQ